MIRLYVTKYKNNPISNIQPGQKHTFEHRLGMALLSYSLFKKTGHLSTIPELEAQVIKGEVGKPKLKDHPGFHYSISHCPGLVICAVSEDPIGADVEGPRTVRTALYKKTLSESEAKLLVSLSEADQNDLFLRLWTLKESYLKYTGEGITRDLRTVSFDLSEDTIACNIPDVFFYHQKTDTGHYLSVCSPKPINDISLIVLEHADLERILHD